VRRRVDTLFHDARHGCWHARVNILFCSYQSLDAGQPYRFEVYAKRASNAVLFRVGFYGAKQKEWHNPMGIEDFFTEPMLHCDSGTSINGASTSQIWEGSCVECGDGRCVLVSWVESVWATSRI
jgi:hypothetical protein